MRFLVIASLLATACAEQPAPPPAGEAVASAQLATGPGQVSFRGRLGNNVEALTAIAHTPFVSLLAALDGYDVVAVPLLNTRPGISFPQLRFGLFSLRAAAEKDGQPGRGIAFDPGRQRFYVGGVGGPAPLIRVFDRSGGEQTPIALALLPGQGEPIQLEGLAYIPPGLPRFGDRIAAVLIGPDGLGRISIARLDGAVEYEVPVVPGSPAENYVTGLAFEPPGSFLFTPLGATSSVVYRTDFDGNVTGPVLAGEPAFSFEGIVALPGGRIAVSEYALGRALVFDAAGGRLANQDRDFHVGPGVSIPDGVAWDSSRSRLLVNGISGSGTAPRNVYALGPDFRSAAQITHVESAGLFQPLDLAYLADRDAVAVVQGAGPLEGRGIWLFDAAEGAYQSLLALGTFPQAAFRPRRVTPLPGGDLAMRIRLRPELIQIVTGTGTPDPVDPTILVPQAVRTVTLNPVPGGGGLDHDAATGRLLVDRQYYDLDGNALAPLTGFPADFLGRVFAHIGSGPLAGQVAGVDFNNSELVIFRPSR